MVQRLAKEWTVWTAYPSGGREFSHQPDRAWGPPCLLYKWYLLCPVVQQPGCGADHPSTSSTEVIERAELYSYSASKPSKSFNWGTETCVSRKSPSSCMLAIPAFDRVARLYNRHLTSYRGICFPLRINCSLSNR